MCQKTQLEYGAGATLGHSWSLGVGFHFWLKDLEEMMVLLPKTV